MCNGKSTKAEREAAGSEARGVTLSHAVRTTVSVETFAWLEREATERGTTVAAMVRDMLDSAAEGEGEGEPVPVPGKMSAAELTQMKAWNKSVMLGDWAGKKPADWRAAIDPLLRERGADLPPLPGDHDALIAWAHAVHRIIAPSSAIVPPRWTGEQE